MKSVRIWIYSGPHFPAFGLNTERYFVSLRIQSECGKIRALFTQLFISTYSSSCLTFWSGYYYFYCVLHHDELCHKISFIFNYKSPSVDESSCGFNFAILYIYIYIYIYINRDYPKLVILRGFNFASEDSPKYYYKVLRFEGFWK